MRANSGNRTKQREANPNINMFLQNHVMWIKSDIEYLGSGEKKETETDVKICVPVPPEPGNIFYTVKFSLTVDPSRISESTHEN